MSVGLLLLTHEAVGPALVSAARHVLPTQKLRLEVLEVPPSADPEAMRRLTANHAQTLDEGDGVLALSDLYGATPCNIGLSMSELGVRMRCVSGLNLPMLLRVLNYAEKPLDELAEIAACGGRIGICIDHA